MPLLLPLLRLIRSAVLGMSDAPFVVQALEFPAFLTATLGGEPQPPPHTSATDDGSSTSAAHGVTLRAVAPAGGAVSRPARQQPLTQQLDRCGRSWVPRRGRALSTGVVAPSSFEIGIIAGEHLPYRGSAAPAYGRETGGAEVVAPAVSLT